MTRSLPDQTSIIAIEAMDGGMVHVSHDHKHGLTALSVAWEGGCTSVEMAAGQVALLIAALRPACDPAFAFMRATNGPAVRAAFRDDDASPASDEEEQDRV